jgi:Ca2+-binding RTX toxin-like protein
VSGSKLRRVTVFAAAFVLMLAGLGAVAQGANVINCTPAVTCQGTSGDDVLKGTPQIDALYADAGNDTLLGRGKLDDLRGEQGNDRLNGGRGNDQYNFYGVDWGSDKIVADRGGPHDWLIFQMGSMEAQPVSVNLIPSPARDEVVLGANTINIARGVKMEWVQAGLEPDVIKGNRADNYLSGNDLGDMLMGRRGNDHLLGDIEAFSNVGDDTLNGGPGRDQLDGGPGDDTILAKDGEKDHIDCGDGTDTVTYDHGLDVLTPDC